MSTPASAAATSGAASGVDAGTPSLAANRPTGDETFITTPHNLDGLAARTGSPTASRMSTPGGEFAATAGGAVAGGEPGMHLDGVKRPAGTGSSSAGAGEAVACGGGGRGGLSRVPSANTFGDTGLFSMTIGGGAAAGGLKRARDRRADRRRKKDPLEALEERLLEGFSVESITRRLEQQDETLQKGVREFCHQSRGSSFEFGVCVRCAFDGRWGTKNVLAGRREKNL